LLNLLQIKYNKRISIFAKKIFKRAKSAFLFLIATQLCFCLPALAADDIEGPFTLSVYKVDPWIDGGIILASTLGTLYGYSQVNNLVKRRCPCDASEVNSFDRSATSNNDRISYVAANVLLTGALVAPPIINSYDVRELRVFIEDLFVYLEVISTTQAVTTFTKIATQRPFPQHYAMANSGANEEGGGAYLSFFSGHTATAVGALSAASMTYMYRYHQSAWPWVITGTVGTLLAVELVAAGEHYPSDVIVGGLVGVAIGTLIPYLHHRKSVEISLMIPTNSHDQLGLVWTKYFN
jgi:membrane-associated phospholipid phosphatase